MIRASSRSAVSHLHVVASQPATTPDDAPLIERAVELEVLAGAVRRLADGRRRGRRARRARGPGQDGAARARRAVRRRRRLPRAPRRAGPARAPLPLRRRARAAGGAAARGLRRASARSCSTAPRRRRARCCSRAPSPAATRRCCVAHSVLWLCAALAERRPLALVVDDAQWADRSSLEVLAYLARRIDDLPLLIAVGARADDPRAAVGPAEPARRRALGHRAAPAAAHAPRRGAADPPRWRRTRSAVVCRDCHRAVGGNPWLLGELGRQIATHGPEAIDAAGDDAPPVSAIARNVVRWRLATLSAARPRGRRGAGGHRRRRAPARRRGRRRRRRRASWPRPATRCWPPACSAPDGERLAHGLVAAAIGEDLTRTECERLHREAARALMAGRADADVVASHLLQCRPAGRPGGQRAAGARRVDGGAARGAAHRRGLPRARAAGARAGRRPRAHARPAGDASPSTPACPTRSGACSRRCPRCAIARAASTCSRAWPRSTSLGTGDADHAELFEQRAGRRDAIPARGWRSRPRRSTR